MRKLSTFTVNNLQMHFFVILLTVLPLILSSCTEEMSEKSDYSLVNAETVVKELGGKYSTGAVELRKVNNDFIIVTVDSMNNGIVEKVFLLQLDSTTSTYDNNEISIPDAEILYFKHTVLINSKSTKQRVFLAINTEEQGEVFNKLPREYKLSYSMTEFGYGLATMGGKWPSLVDKINKHSTLRTAIIQESLILDDKTKANLSTMQDCTAGGVGTSECAMAFGYCSVKCSSGYYACCDFYDGCKCIKTVLKPKPPVDETPN